ncbi:DNA-binding response regulator, OmpR family, contains REC and winged-helix (wHTH) domain [Austwickia chelonae]|uniref:Putative two-component response regulator n=1 Tax=Austwickia chelonae NBRC 105200 TaxID=1184607 RepID=K6WBA9_9MICO|nr:response regulator transcription factor [Austwickia chelonae]GAB79112.1 putative two-component response regulator [Austwickia chelonae NBRC 105200]SEW42355.1 DNA-binding response regulator, OmpR family, contains REC and winged-helix (wHTH) domain [Austwickia chelonae]
MTGGAPRALIVDDERQMLSIIEFALETQGFACITATSAERAWSILNTEQVDLIILDVMLPGASGEQLCRRIRTRSDVPVMMLTARGTESDRVGGFLAGADDYITKPFSPRELALRAQAVVRRTRQRHTGELIVNGPLLIDVHAGTASWQGRRLRLSQVEHRLLTVLARHSGSVVGWRDLLNEVWGTGETVGGRDMIKTTVYRLRRQLRFSGDELIVTARGSGYLMPRLEDDTLTDRPSPP